jgi:PAS domain S-box-containing protein
VRYIWGPNLTCAPVLRRYLEQTKEALRLRGPLAADPMARILHALLAGLLLYSALHAVVFLQLVAKPLACTALDALSLISFGTAMILLNRGAHRKASIVYLSGTWAVATILILLNGGVRSSGFVLYIAVPISAAWLLGRRAVLLSTGACLAMALALAITEVLWGPFPSYFPGTPFGIWAIILESTVIAAVPAMVVLRTLNDSLAATKRWLEDLRDSEIALRHERDLVNRLMETSPIGIVAINREGVIAFANSEAERIFGLTRDEVTQRTYNDPGWRATTHEGAPYPDEELPFRLVQSRGGAVHDIPVAIARPDGERILLSVNAAPMETLAGQFDGVVAALEDVTERARTEEELRKHREHLEDLVARRTEELSIARDQAVAANRAKSVFLANMSHELRTPLNAILGFSSLMRDNRDLSAAYREKVDIISRSGEILLNLIDDVLDMAKIEAGRSELAISPCDLESLVHDVIEMVRVRANAKNLALLAAESAGFPKYVRVDPAKLRQVLLNLLSNAVQYTDRGSITLRMDSHPLGTKDGLGLTFEVIDTGIGIAPEDHQRIFESFTQIGKPGERKGTGLGLTITEQFVRIMGGSILVESTPGLGSSFRVVLPAVVALPSELPDAAADRQSILRLSPGQPEYCVLVVEDEAQNRLLLESLLQRAGFQVQTASDGAQGVAAFQAWRPHFIWMDLRMPVMDGFEATRHIRALDGGQNVKIVAVTASASKSDREEVLSAGLDDFVRKPYRPAEIFDCLARHLGVRYDSDPGELLLKVKSTSKAAPEALAALPDDVRVDLRNSLITLDVKRIASAIRRVSDCDAALGEALSGYADRFAYTAILDALGDENRMTIEKPA